MSNALITLITDMNSGRSVARASEELINLCNSVDKHGGSAILTMKIKVKSIGEGSPLEFGLDFAGKPASAPSAKAMFYYSEENGLTKRDPHQPEFPSIVEQQEKQVNG